MTSGQSNRTAGRWKVRARVGARQKPSNRACRVGPPSRTKLWGLRDTPLQKPRQNQDQCPPRQARHAGQCVRRSAGRRMHARLATLSELSVPPRGQANQSRLPDQPIAQANQKDHSDAALWQAGQMRTVDGLTNHPDHAHKPIRQATRIRASGAPPAWRRFKRRSRNRAHHVLQCGAPLPHATPHWCTGLGSHQAEVS